MKIDKFNMLFSLVLLFVVLNIYTQKNNNSTFFINYEEAKIYSAQKDKPLFICFNSSLSNQKISDFKKIKEDYIVCILDLEKDKDVFEKYNITKIPSYIVLDRKNKTICKEEGYKDKKILFDWLSKLRENNFE
jgi:thioredoxin-related protein